MDEWESMLEEEAKWISDEYHRCFHVRKVIENGTPMSQVHSMQSAIIRFYVSKLKTVIEEYKR